MQTFETNSAFSRLQPNLQLAWDSVSSGLAKECWRKYELAILEGWESRQRNFHLSFGIWLHEAKEKYDSARSAGKGYEDAILVAVQHVMCATWNKELRRPWDSGNENKNRFTLVRSVVWYLTEYKDDPIQTVQLADGRAAVELSFSFDSGFVAGTGEAFQICGHLDRIGVLGTGTFGCDIKTSKYQLDERWFNQFSPHNQFTIYTLAMKVVYSLPAQGLIVDGVQVAVTFSRFLRGQVPRSESQLEEWLQGFGALVAQAEVNARRAFWPMNEMSCQKYGENSPCVFRGICARPPAARGAWLKSDFTKRTWNPLAVRGDV